MEKWKPLKDYEGWYEISNIGNVRNIKKEGKAWKGRYKKNRKLGLDAKGYLRIRIGSDKTKTGKTIKIHREVAKAFLPNPKNLPEVNHIDGNKENNNVENLEWVSSGDNYAHAVEIGLRKPCGGLSTPKTVHQFNKDKKHIGTFHSTREAEMIIGKQGISCACKKGTKVGGYYWSYNLNT